MIGKLINIDKTYERLTFLMVGLIKVLNNSVPIILTLLITTLEGNSIELIGQLTYILVTVNFLSLITDFGFSDTLQNFVNRYVPAKVIFPAIFWKFLATLAISLLVVFLEARYKIFLLGNTLNLFLFVGILLSSQFNSLILLFNSLQQSLHSLFYELMYVLFVLAWLLLFLWFEINPITSTLASLFLANFLVSIWMIFDLWQSKLIKYNLLLPKGFFSFCVVNFVFIATIMLYTQSDSVFITNILESDVGEYFNSIYKPIVLFGFLPRIFGLIIATPVFPILVRLFYQAKYDRLIKIFDRVLIFLSLTGAIFVILAYTYGQTFVNSFYPESTIINFTKEILPIIILSFSFHSINYNLAYFFQAVGQKLLIYIVSILQLLVFLTGIVFLTNYGIIFPAITLLAVELIALMSYMSGYFLFKINLKKLINIKW